MFIGRIIFDTIFFLGVAFVFNKKLRNYVKRGIRKVSLNSLVYGVWRYIYVNIGFELKT